MRAKILFGLFLLAAFVGASAGRFAIADGGFPASCADQQALYSLGKAVYCSSVVALSSTGIAVTGSAAIAVGAGGLAVSSTGLVTVLGLATLGSGTTGHVVCADGVTGKLYTVAATTC